MPSRDDGLPLAPKLDWDYSCVREDKVFPEVISGRPWLPHSEWKEWDSNNCFACHSAGIVLNQSALSRWLIPFELRLLQM